MLVGLGTALPWLIAVGVPLAIVWLLVRRRIRARRATLGDRPEAPHVANPANRAATEGANRATPEAHDTADAPR